VLLASSVKALRQSDQGGLLILSTPDVNFSLVHPSLCPLLSIYLRPDSDHNIGDHRHLSTEMPWNTSLESSTPRRNGAPVKERVTGVSHVADDPASPRAKGRVVLPSNSPSSTYRSGEKRRQNKSPSPERTEQQKKDLKKRKLNRQSCSYCYAEKQKVYNSC
jgi:hypothetical protein